MGTIRGARAALVGLLVVGSSGMAWAQAQQSSTQTGTQNTVSVIEAARLQAALEPVAEKTIPLFTLDSAAPFGSFWMLVSDTPPLPFNPFPELPVFSAGGDLWLVDDRSVDYLGLRAALAELLTPMSTSSGVPFPPEGGEGEGEGGSDPGPSVAAYNYTTNDLWLEITAFTNHAASLIIHRPWNDTNAFHDLLYTTNLSSPINWHLVQRCIFTNVLVPDLCDAQGFFRLGQTNGSITVTTNRTPQELAQLLVPPWVTVTNATYTGADVARGTFAGGHGCGLPIESGVILSSGNITNAAGPNNDSSGHTENYGSDLGTPGDTNLDGLVGGDGTTNAAVLEFDLVSPNSFVLKFQYIYASEEYPEFIGEYNDPMAIFVTTNHVGTNWIITTNDNFALVPGSNLAVTVNSIHGGCISSAYGQYISPTNPQYYLDNDDPNYSAVPPYAAAAPVYNVQYDGLTVLLTAAIYVPASVTNHVKIAIEDYRDSGYDSAVFIKAAQTPCP